MAATTNQVTANGVRFTYLEEGRGPLVLMFHGFPDTPQTWDRARPALAAAGYRVVTPFLRGYPPTEIPKDGAYDVETLGRDALALVEALGERDAVMVGHDWGAITAFAATALDATKVRKLVTLAIPHPAGVRVGLKAVWALRHFIRLRRKGAAAWMRANDFRYVDALLKRWSPSWDVPAGETDAVKRSFREPGGAEAAVAYYAALKFPPGPFLRKKVPVPAVAFAGATDVLPASAYEGARRGYTGSYEIVPMAGGHFMHREDPDRFVSELVRTVGPPSDVPER